MSWKSHSIILLLLIKFLSISGLRNCFIDDNPYDCKFGMKTPYRNVANYEDSPINFSGCTEKKIWLLIRHGTRYPKKKHILSIVEELPRIQKLIISNFYANKTILTESNVAKLAEWNMTFELNHAMLLTEEGENEMIDLAERFQSRFPKIFNQDYNNDTYKFKYTATQRAEFSAKHFVLGLFGMKNSLKVSYEKAEHEDPILRFYKRCKRWRKDIHKTPAANQERDKFIASRVVENMLNEISDRIGEKLDFNAVLLMYLVCSFETAWGQVSPWCNLLSSQDFEILEYSEDLKHFWKDGYGHSLNCDQSCSILKDMFKFFESNENLSAVSYFTHSGTLLKLLCLLGLSKDETPLTSDSFLLHKDNRVWRTSLIDAFASNIAFVLYDCKSQGPSILFMHQERIVQLPKCPQNIPCPVVKMKDAYPDNDDECKFDEMCSLKEKKLSNS